MVKSFFDTLKSLPADSLYAVALILAVLFFIYKIVTYILDKKHELDRARLDADIKTAGNHDQCNTHTKEITDLKVDVGVIKSTLDSHIESQKYYNNRNTDLMDKLFSRIDEMSNKISELSVLFQQNNSAIQRHNRVLIVDDREDIRHMLTLTIQRRGNGASVDAVATYHEAMALMGKVKYTHFFIDYDLNDPKFTGIDICNHAILSHPGASIKLYTGKEAEDLPPNLRKFHLEKNKIFDENLI